MRLLRKEVWYRPKIVIGYKVFEYGKESEERAIQKLREQSVLQALFFNKNMLPDNPQEPDLKSEEPEESKQALFLHSNMLPDNPREPDLESKKPEEPKTIPMDDLSGSEEFLYNYDSHPQAVQTKGGPSIHSEPNKDAPFQPPMNPAQQSPTLPLGFQLPPGLQLPRDLANILVHMHNMPGNPNDPVMTQVKQILNSFMCGGSEQSYEQLQQIQQIMNSQMGLLPDGMMQGSPPGMLMMGMPPPNGPAMGPRTLLGNAPPGFMPLRPMGPGSSRFGPPGPGPQGNWGPQGNIGGPQMGLQGGNLRGPMRGLGRGQRGGMGGVKFKVLCKHFAHGKCWLGNKCSFLHPGHNGPPMSDMQMKQTMDQMGNS